MGETTTFLRRRSWKTTLAGLLTAAGVAMRKHPATLPWADLVEMAGVTLLGAAAADHKKDPKP
jgi:hypothetical protein